MKVGRLDETHWLWPMTTLEAEVAAVKVVVGDIPHMDLNRAQTITRLIDERQVSDVLELGFCHGVSSCYIASALRRRGGGHLVTIDRADRLAYNSPPVEELLEALGARGLVTIFYEFSSYNWRLYHFLSQERPPEFDLIYLDGAHTWEVDGFAFLLAERMLAPGGLIVFDDIHWTLGSSPWARAHTTTMPADERDTAQVGLICEHLVRTHPNIEHYWEDGPWGLALKRDGPRLSRDGRDVALAAIAEQAAEVYARSSAALGSAAWHYMGAPWPSSDDQRSIGEAVRLRNQVAGLERVVADLRGKLDRRSGHPDVTSA